MDEIKSDKIKEDDVFVTDLKIQKVRHLKDIHIPLSKTKRKHLILTGKNGSGKTSVLEGLKAYFLDMMEPKAILMEGSIIDNKDDVFQLEIEVNSNKFAEYFTSGNFLLSYYGARRGAEMNVPKGLKKIDIKKIYSIDEQPGKNLIQHIVNLKAEKSFARDEREHETVKKIEDWFDIFEKSLREIFDDPTLKLKFDRKNFNFNIIQEGKEPFDFNTMADGYSAIINIVVDLILRMDKHKGKSYDIQGIVLIDELEAHLHIDLQKKIFPFLNNFFPRIQFIVTTHSPFILNSIENAIIYDLEKQLLVEDLSAYSYDGIVESYFDNDKYSQEIKNKIERYEKLTKKKKLSQKEEEQMIELRMYLKEVPGSLSPELKVKFQQIELERKKA